MARKITDEQVAAYYEEYDTGNDDLPLVEVEIAVEPMVVRSLRLPFAVTERLRVIADERGVGSTELMRRWIEEGVDAAERGVESAQVESFVRDLSGAFNGVIRTFGIDMSTAVRPIADRAPSTATRARKKPSTTTPRTKVAPHKQARTKKNSGQ